MASNTKATRVKRKNKQARKSTASNAELFAGLGEPGKPAPKA